MFYSNYLKTIKENLSLKKEDLNFKSNPYYREILEHVNSFQGKEYLELIKTEFAEKYVDNKDHLIELCQKNDLYGKTNKMFFDDFCECSPSNLRYIYHSFLILDYIKENNLNDLDIIEIGGGYGGLSFFIHNLSKIYGLNIKTYSMFDLDEAMDLQKMYLNIFGIDINICGLGKEFNLKPNSFLISNYAFSEIDMDLQKEYIEKVIQPFTSHGFLAWNGDTFYDFVKGKNIQKEVERPLTGGNNLFVYYKPQV